MAGIILLTYDLRRMLNPNDVFATEASSLISDGSDGDDGDDDGGYDGFDVDGGAGVEEKLMMKDGGDVDGV